MEGKIFETDDYQYTMKKLEQDLFDKINEEEDRKLFNLLDEYINNEENKGKHADKIYDNYSVTTHDPVIENYVKNLRGKIDAAG